MDSLQNPNDPTIVGWKTAGVAGAVVGLFVGRSKVLQNVSGLVNLDFQLVDALAKRFRWSKVTRDSVNGSMWFGTGFAMHSGVYNWITEKRGAAIVSNHVVAGAASCCTLGLMVAPPVLSATTSGRACCGVIGSIVGAVSLAPVGWLHLMLLEDEKKRAISGKATMKDV